MPGEMGERRLFFLVRVGVLSEHTSPSGVVPRSLENARAEIARHLADADPDLVTAARAAELVTLFAEIERLGAAGKVLYAQRAAQSMVWRDEGHRSAASWMAQRTGIGIGEALGTLEASVALGSLPETTEALRKGPSSRHHSSKSSPGQPPQIHGASAPCWKAPPQATSRA